MKGCLLCLVIRIDSVGGIQADSTKWLELNVQALIEKHFWSMHELQTLDSWLCTDCWQELNDFHKFYRRIEEAHTELEILKQNKSEIENEDFKSSIENVTFVERHFEPEIAIKEEEIVIKKEDDEESLLDEHLPLNKSKYASQTKLTEETTFADDPLSKNQNKKSSSRKTRNVKIKETEKIIADKFKTHSKNTSKITEYNEIKNEPDLMETDEIEPNSADSDTGKSTKNTNENDIFLRENFKITCSICQVQTETFHALCKHFKEEHKQIGFVTCCNKKFIRRGLLVDHIHQHIDPNYFKCTICDKVMADRKCLNMHNKTHNDNKEKVHQCDICHKKFSIFKSLKLHKMSHLSEDEKHVPCTECDKKFGSKSLLTNHIRSVHLKKYINICDICGREIRSREIFERHMLQHEGKSLPKIACDVCGLLLVNKHSLRQHKRMVHHEGGKTEFTCPVCGKISPNLKAHRKHVQYNHERGYDHKCTMCDKAFKAAHTLTEHMASHTGTVLYTCPWCSKTFNSNANFHSHRKNSHRKEWEEATRAKYSGNLPPNYNPPPVNNAEDGDLPLYII